MAAENTYEIVAGRHHPIMVHGYDALNAARNYACALCATGQMWAAFITGRQGVYAVLNMRDDERMIDVRDETRRFEISVLRVTPKE